MTNLDNTSTVYVLIATGRTKSLEAPWRCIYAVAHIHLDTAENSVERFRQACLRPTHPVTDPIPETLRISVVPLELVDHVLDEEPSRLFLLNANGASAVHNGSFRSLCKRAFTVREDAESYKEHFRLACLDSTIGFDFAQSNNLIISTIEIELDNKPFLQMDAVPR